MIRILSVAGLALSVSCTSCIQMQIVLFFLDFSFILGYADGSPNTMAAQSKDAYTLGEPSV
jgi:hypothetical protein